MFFSDFHYNLFKALIEIYKGTFSFDLGSNQIRFQLEHCNCERKLNLREIETTENFDKKSNWRGKSEI